MVINYIAYWNHQIVLIFIYLHDVIGSIPEYFTAIGYNISVM